MSSCHKRYEGCTDPYAANYNSYIKQENNDNSCYFYCKYSIGFTKEFGLYMRIDGFDRVDLRHQDSLYPVFDSLTVIDTTSIYGITGQTFYSRINKKYDTTSYELICYKNLNIDSIIKGTMPLVGGESSTSKH